MEKQDLKNLLENIYHLLAEDAPLPTAGGPRGTVQPGYAPGTHPQETTSFWNYDQWITDHPDSIPSGIGPWNGTWIHPTHGNIYALPPSNWPGPNQKGGTWTGWRDGKQNEYPLPPGDFPGSGMNGQWVYTFPPDMNMYYIYPQSDGSYVVWLWYGLPGANSYFIQQKSWGA